MDLRAIAMGVGFAVMWSSAFTSGWIIVSAAPPLTALSLRFLISGLLGVFLARMMGQTWKLTARQWRATILFGLCQNALYLGLNFVAMRSIEASLAAILASTMPLLVALAGWLIFRERLSRIAIAGLFAGMGGVVIIMASRLQSGVDLHGMLLCIAGVIALTIATLTVRGAMAGGNFLMVVGLQLLVGAAVLSVIAIAMEPFEVSWSWSLAAAFSYTTLVPGLTATLVWFLLVERIGATRAAAFHFLNPFFGVLVAAVILGEPLRLSDLIGVSVIMAGILAVQLSRSDVSRQPRAN